MNRIVCFNCHAFLGWLHQPVTQKVIDEDKIHDEHPKFRYYCNKAGCHS